MTIAADNVALAATTRDTWTTAHTNAALAKYAKRLAYATDKYRDKLATYADALAAIEPLHNRAAAYCAVTVRRPEAGGTGVTVTVAAVEDGAA